MSPRSEFVVDFGDSGHQATSADRGQNEVRIRQLFQHLQPRRPLSRDNIGILKRMYENMGGIRYTIMVILLLFMAMMPIKMVLRWLFNMKYFVYLPEFNANL